LAGRVPLSTLNPLLVSLAVPLVWLIWAFARWSAYQHAARWARDIEKVHGPQVVTAGRVRK
jgi:putative effector of murein hydrolase